MILLFVYVIIVLGFLFLCFIVEVVILSVFLVYIFVLEKEQKFSGVVLCYLIEDINCFLLVILIFNIIVYIMGVVGVGVQVVIVFGDVYLGLILVILILLILIFLEIIFKILGVMFWCVLVLIIVYFLKYLVILFYFFVKMLEWLIKGFKEESLLCGFNWVELYVMVEFSGEEGQFNEYEVFVMKSLFIFNELMVKDVIIYCIQVFLVLEIMIIIEFFYKYGSIKYLCILIYEEGDFE